MFGSSAINKSGKKFAPKAPVRRRPAAADSQPPSTTTSARPSTEPQTTPDASLHVAQAAPAPSETLDTSPQDSSVPGVEPSDELSSGRSPKRRKIEAPAASARPAPSSAQPTRPDSATSTPDSAPGQALDHPGPGAAQPDLSAISGSAANVITQPENDTRARGGSTGNDEGDQHTTVPTPQAVSRKTQGKRRADTGEQPSTGSDGATSPTTAQKSQKARKERGASTSAGDSGDTQAENVSGPSSTTPKPIPIPKRIRRRAVKTPSNEPNASGERKSQQRAGTPDDAEDMTIDEEKDTMASITKDRRIGKVSEREKQMRQIDWDEVHRRRRETRANARPRRRGPTPERTDEDGSARHENGDEGASAFNYGVPANQHHAQVRLVNGVLVTDEATLVIDRQAALQSNNATLETIEESDITTSLNSQSWLNANKRDVGDNEPLYTPTDRWSVDQTDAFYDALRMFGTDFSIISHMFPGRTRRNIKHKFVKEERADPARIKAALNGEKLPMDFQTYLSNTGQQASDFKDPRALDEEMKMEDERHRAEIEDAKKTYEETQRQRRLAEGGAEGDPETGKEAEAGSRKSRKKKRGKNETMGGEEVEVLGTIED